MLAVVSVVDAAEPHGGDALGRDLDRVDAALGRHAGMRLEPVHDELEMVRRGRAREEIAGGVAVEHEPGAGGEAAHVEVLGAEQPDLLADRERDLDVAVRDRVVAQHAQHLADDRAARLVVAAEDRRAVAADDVAVDDRLHALAGDDGVHVRREQQRRRRRAVPRTRASRLPGRAADLGAGVVEPDLGPELAQLARQALGDRALLPRMAVDPNQLEEERGQSLA